MFLFVTQAFWVFIVGILFFSVQLGLFEITEWQPMKRDAVWLNSFKPLKIDNCQCCEFP